MLLPRLWNRPGARRGGDTRRQTDPISLVVGLVSIILAPLAAMVIQLAISRAREYEADHSGATITGSPLALARALQKLEVGTSRIPMPINPSTAQLFIADPLKALRSRASGGGGMSGLGGGVFHPPPPPQRPGRAEGEGGGGPPPQPSAAPPRGREASR